MEMNDENNKERDVEELLEELRRILEEGLEARRTHLPVEGRVLVGALPGVKEAGAKALSHRCLDTYLRDP